MASSALRIAPDILISYSHPLRIYLQYNRYDDFNAFSFALSEQSFSKTISDSGTPGANTILCRLVNLNSAMTQFLYCSISIHENRHSAENSLIKWIENKSRTRSFRTT